MNICIRRWLHHCLKCQARKTSRLTARWPIISMPLPEGPGIAPSVDYSGPIPVTPRGNTSCSPPIVLAIEPTYSQPSLQLKARLRLSSTGIFPSVDTRAAYPRTTVSGCAPSFRMPSATFLGFGKVPPDPTTQMAICGVELVDYTMPQMLVMVFKE